jgi:hypothetical protein
MTSLVQPPTPWLTRPLCRRYLLGVLDIVTVKLCRAGGHRDHPVLWGIGWLANGECEPLGAWAGGLGGLPLMLTDMKARGVERVWHMAAFHVAVLEHGEPVTPVVEAAFPGALATTRPEVIPAADSVAQQVREYLIRVIRRHGPFENEAAALDFIAVGLQRAERRLDRERLVAKERPRLDSGARMAPHGI